MIAGESSVEKKGNKENNNGNAMEKKSSSDGDKNVNAGVVNDTTIDTSFLINKVNDHAAIQHQSSDQHTEL